MKRSIWICVLILVVSVSYAAANCPDPVLQASASAAAPGIKVTLTGRYFTDGCHDVGRGSLLTYPAKGIRILFIQGKKTQEIARVDANAKFEVNTVVTIPANASVGEASIVAESKYEGSHRTRPIPFTVSDAH